MTYEELKERVLVLSEKLEAADADDAKLLRTRIELRQLLNRMDIAVVPTLDNHPLEVDVDALIEAVSRDIAVEAKRANLLSQVGKVIDFVKGVLV